MQPRAAHGTGRDAGWSVALILALFAAALSATALAFVVVRAFDEPPPRADALDQFPTATAQPSATSAIPTATHTPPALASRTPRPSVTVAPVQPFGRSLTLVDDRGLRERIEDALGDKAPEFGVVVVRSADGRAAFVDPDRVFYSASLFKLAVLYEAGLRLSRAELALDDRLHLSEEDLAEDLGTAQYLDLAEDGTLSIQETLEAMVTFSDNSTAVALLHLFGGGTIDSTLRGLGIETMSVSTTELPTTARDMARLMDAVVAGEGLDPATQELLMGMLSRQQIRGGVPAGLPDGVVSGNKTGTWDSITHDVAYVLADSGAYVIAVLSASDRDWRTIADVSEAVYTAMAED